ACEVWESLSPSFHSSLQSSNHLFAAAPHAMPCLSPLLYTTKLHPILFQSFELEVCVTFGSLRSQFNYVS
ncbi:hypothetical protein Csa_013808, partial [Cucumis sativus]